MIVTSARDVSDLCELTSLRCRILKALGVAE